MLDSVASQTAVAAAFLRALHVAVDPAPPILDDTAALDLLPDYQQRFIRRLTTLASPWQRRFSRRLGAVTSMRAQIVVRARYAEDALADAVESGVGRYVVLAAGLDTFALRQPEPAIDVVEIDHPATQAWKRTLVDARGRPPPANLTYLSIDFERESLDERWIANPAPDFVSWLGSTYYLSREAIESTLTTLRRRTESGTRLVLDYWSEPLRPGTDAALLWSTRAIVALQGEAMRSFFAPDDMQALAIECGWRIREHCGPEVQTQRYLAAPHDGMRAPSFAWLLQLEH